MRAAAAGRSGVAPGRAAADRQHDDRDSHAKRADIGGPVDLFAVDELIYGVLAIADRRARRRAVSADGLAARLLFTATSTQERRSIMTTKESLIAAAVAGLSRQARRRRRLPPTPRSLPGRQRLQGQGRLQGRGQLVQGPERLQGQGMVGCPRDCEAKGGMAAPAKK